METELHLSFGQRRFWALDQIDNVNSAYNMPLAFSISGALDVESLKKSLHFIVMRHEALRTLIKIDDAGVTKGILIPQLKLDDIFSYKNISEDIEVNEKGLEHKVRALIEGEASKPFLLGEEPPIRFVLTKIQNLDYVLSITLHHHASDGTSLDILINELNLFYHAYNCGQEPDLAPLSIQYSDWAAWHDARLQKTIDDKLARATERLKIAPPLLSLPLDKPRSSERARTAGYIPIQLNSNTTMSLRRLAQKENTTLFNVTLAVFAHFLHRISGQMNVVVGAPVSGRDRPEIQNIIGYFINTVAFPIELASHKSVSGLMQHVKNVAQNVLVDQDIPFERLVDELAHERSLEYSPIFQAMLSFQSSTQCCLSLEGTTCTPYQLGLEASKFDLVLALEQGQNNDLVGFLEFDKDLFDTINVQRWAQSFISLANNFAEGSDVDLATLQILSSDEATSILKNSCGNYIPADPDIKTLPLLFSLQAEKTPDLVALIFEDKSLTYGELDRRSNQFARYLVSKNVGPDDIVAILLDRSFEMIIAMLGVLKAGGAYLPLDPAYPSARLHFMIEDSKAKYIVTSQYYSETLDTDRQALPPEIDLTSSVILEHLQELPASPIKQAERVSPLHSEHLAYLIYTSGSTGRPKGAGNTHSAINNRLMWMQDALKLDESDRVLQKTAIGFDVAVWEWFLPIMTGARLIVARPGGHKDPSYLVRLIDNQSVSVLHFVPSMLAVFLEEPTIDLCSSIRQIVTSGEALSGSLQNQTFTILPHTKLWNLYGPTEAAIDVTVWSCRPENAALTPPIGRPIWNTQLYILDNNLELVPDGVVGELYIAGAGLARGYLGRPGLTSERFIACPYGGPGERMYRTGDLTRRRSDGEIEYLGRGDDQVKVRGFRIELGEIEASLLSNFESLSQAAVIVREINGDKRIIAYLVSHEGLDVPDVSLIRSRLGVSLPEYMVPTYFVSIDALPLTPNGKLDRKALPDPELSGSEESYVAPSTPQEKLLCDLFAELTGTERVGIHDGFFSIGGDSISAIRLVSRARAEELNFTVRDVFANQNPKALASVAKKEKLAGSVENWPENGLVPALPIYLDMLKTSNSLDRFNQAVCLKVPDGVTRQQVEIALTRLQEHHAALRLRTEGVGHETKFIIDPSGECPAPRVSVLELNTVTKDDPHSVLEDHFDRLSLELTPGQPGGMIIPLWVEQTDHSALLILVIHHFAVDGVSWRILLDDLASLTSNTDCVLPTKTMSLRAWGEHLAKEGEQGLRRQEEDLWLDQLSSIKLLPQDNEISKTQNTLEASANIKGMLSSTETERLLLAPNTYHSGIDAIMLTSVGMALCEWSKKQYDYELGDPIILTEGHGREGDVDLTQTVGWFTSSFPVRMEVSDLDLSDNHSLGYGIRRTKECLRNMPDKGIGYGILKHYDPNSTLSSDDFNHPQIIFNYLGRFERTSGHSNEWQFADFGFSSSGDVEDRQRGHLIEINAIIDQQDRLQFDITYCSLAHEKDSIVLLARTVEQALKSSTSHCLENPLANRYTPTDFPLVGTRQSKLSQPLDQKMLDEIHALYPTLEDILPLTPAQQGLVFESMARDKNAVDPYHVQVMLTLKGNLNIEIMEEAWKVLIKENDILRMIPASSSISSELGIICGSQFVDFREIKLNNNIDDCLDALQRQDLEEGFDKTDTPFVRLKVFDLGNNEFIILIAKHHMVLDGWSLPVLVTRLKDIYEALLKNENASGSGNFRWQDHLLWLSTQSGESADAYWRNHLAGVNELCRIGAENQGLAKQETGKIYAHLDTQTIAKLEKFGKKNGLTQATILLGIYALVLAKVSRRDDLVLGNVYSGRNHSVVEIDRAIGLFINTLPVAFNLGSSDTFIEWLKYHQIVQSEHVEHGHIGLGSIQALAGFSGQAIFDALFVFENFPTSFDSKTIGDLTLLDAQFHDTTHYPIALGVFPVNDGVKLRFTFQEGYLTSLLAQTIVNQIIYLTQHVSDFTDKPVSSINTTDITQQKKSLSDSCGMQLSQNAETNTLTELFDQKVKMNPALPCIVYGEGNNTIEQFSYLEVNERANQLARHLISNGAGPEVVVAIMLDPSPEFIISVLAVLKTGAAYLPLDSSYPKSRLAYTIQDSQTTIMISTESLFDNAFPATTASSLTLIDIDSDLLNLRLSLLSEETIEDSELNGQMHSKNLAYLIYTSGSTGNPKGVGISHESAVNLSFAQKTTFELSERDRVLQFASQAFDASVWELLLAFGAGASLVILSSKARGEAGTILSEFLAKFEVTFATLPPALVAVLKDEDLDQLNGLVVAGETCPPSIVKRFAANKKMYNAYGPTEVTVCATASAPLEYQNYGDDDFVTIGSPLPSYQVYLLDKNLDLVAAGMTGEIYIAGDGLSRGYFNKPGLTSERFIACPFSDKAGMRMYRTNDLARRLSDGSLEFLGRSDDQIKIRGYRVELGEIENCILKADSAIAQVRAVVSGIGTAKSIVAYIIYETLDPEIDISALKEELSEVLPKYMLPSHFVVIDKFPLTPSGKLDYQNLPQPDLDINDKGSQEPKTEKEAILCDLFQQLTNKTVVNTNDKFFSIGGDSISAIRLVSQARNKDIIFSVQEVFQYQTPELLAALENEDKLVSNENGIPEYGTISALPIFHQFWNKGGPFKCFNQAVILTPVKGMQIETIKENFGKIIEHHGALRLRLTGEEGNYGLAIDPSVSVDNIKFKTMKLDNLEDGLQSESVRQTFRGLSDELQPGAAGGMIAALWLYDGEGKAKLALVIHHFAIDAVSWQILLDDFNKLLLSPDGKLTPSGMHYRAWSERLSEEGRKGSRRKEETLWLNQFKDFQSLGCDENVNTSKNTIGQGRNLLFKLSAVRTHDLLESVSVYSASMNDLLLTALGFSLSNWNKKLHGKYIENLVVELEGHGRAPDAGLERTVGWFTTVFPVRLDLEGLSYDDSDSFGYAIRRIKETLASMPDKGMGFGILRYLDKESVLNSAPPPLPEIGFNYLGRQQAKESAVPQGWFIGEEGIIGAKDDLERPRLHLLNFNALINVESQLEIEVTFNQLIHDESSIERLFECFDETFIKITNHCLNSPLENKQTPSDFKFLTMKPL